MSKTTRETGPAPASLEVRLLGPFFVAVDGRAVDERRWSRRKPKLLVKLLALQPHHQLHREQLMEALWPESDPESAANNLHKAIHLARRALEPSLPSAANSHFILTQGQQVALSAPEGLWVDVEAFERAANEAVRGEGVEAYEAALALYEGDLLEEDPYEDWAAPRREQLRLRRQGLLAKLARLHEALGEYERGAERLKELLACDPTDEEAHRHLMRLYALAGDRRRALKQYQVCREALRKELAAEPERATAELRQQIAAGRLAPPAPSAETRLVAEAGPPVNSLAVLPLVNSGGDQNTDYLCGISENIIYSLSQLSGLRVMACSTVCRYKGREVDPREVGRELGVQAVVTGRVLQAGGALVVNTELVDARTGEQIWGEQYRRKSSDIFALQEEISRDISEKLRLRLTREERARLARRHTENTDAYHAYLKGRYFWNKRTTGGLKKGAECFRRAIDLDPGYALAYAGLSDSYTNLVTWEALHPREGLAKARAAAESALRIDETLADAHASLAHALLHSWEWEKSGEEFGQAVALNPSYAPAHSWRSEYLAATGNFDEALRAAERACRLDPLSLFISGDIGWVLYLAGRCDEAVEQYRKTLEMEPNFFLARHQLGLTYARKGMYAEAVEELEKAVALTGKSPVSGLLVGPTYALAGRRREALAVLAGLRELSGRRYFSPYRVSVVHACLGDKEQALEWLARSYEEGDAWLIWLKADPLLEGLRSDPRFRDLLRRVGLAQ
jgi:DNA-binding SARP family transcriptional activator/Flp pilus assembly protein TadD